MSPLTPTLSYCARCAPTTANAFESSDEVAVCINCQTSFLLPLTRMLSVTGDCVTPPLAGLGAAIAPEAMPRSTRRGIIAVTFSLFLNAMFFLVLALLYFTTDAGSRIALDGSLQVGEDEAFADLPAMEVGGNPANNLKLDTASAVANLGSEISEVNFSSGQLQGAGGTGKGNGRSGVGNLFGGTGSANSIAYVVDASGSMSGERMDRVLKELETSIRSLKEHQEFFVVFFNKGSFPMMWPKSEVHLLKAHPLNTDRVLKWAFGVEPQASTKPQLALKMALKLEPDLLFLLTDGDVPFNAIRMVKRYRKHTTINCICVGIDADLQAMQEIAKVGEGVVRVAR